MLCIHHVEGCAVQSRLRPLSHVQRQGACSLAKAKRIEKSGPRGRNLMIRKGLIIGAALLATADTACAADGLSIRIAYLRQEIEPPPTLSNLDPCQRSRLAGGTRYQGCEDDRRFLKHDYALRLFRCRRGRFHRRAKQALAATDLLLFDAPASQILVSPTCRSEKRLAVQCRLGERGCAAPNCRRICCTPLLKTRCAAMR